jgi:hypothetical protein
MKCRWQTFLKIASARQFNLVRRHLSRVAKRQLVGDQLQETPQRSDSWIARDLGVTKQLVATVRQSLLGNGTITPYPKLQRADGVWTAIGRAADAKRAAAIDLLRTHPDRADNWIATETGTGGKLIAEFRRQLEREGAIPVCASLVTVRGRRINRRIVDPPPPPVAEQDTVDLRREHARLRARARAIDAELRTRPRPGKRQANPGWVSPGTAKLPDGAIRLEVADAADLRAQVTDGSVDLIVTSPPWNLDVGYDGARDNHQYERLFSADGSIRRFATEMFRIAGPQGRLCLNVPLQSWIGGKPRSVACDWLDQLRAVGWRYRSTILWLKSGAGVKTSGVPVVGEGTPAQPVVGTPATDVVLVLHKGVKSDTPSGACRSGSRSVATRFGGSGAGQNLPLPQVTSRWVLASGKHVRVICARMSADDQVGGQ